MKTEFWIISLTNRETGELVFHGSDSDQDDYLCAARFASYVDAASTATTRFDNMTQKHLWKFWIHKLIITLED